MSGVQYRRVLCLACPCTSRYVIIRVACKPRGCRCRPARGRVRALLEADDALDDVLGVRVDGRRHDPRHVGSVWGARGQKFAPATEAD